MKLTDLGREREIREATEEIAEVLEEHPELQSARTRDFLDGGEEMAKARRGRGRGRPPLDEAGSTQIAIRLSDEILEELDGIVSTFEALGLASTRSDVVRAAVRRGLDALARELPAAGQARKPKAKRKK